MLDKREKQDSATGLALDQTQLEFHGVAGRSTLGQRVSVLNQGSGVVSYRARIEADGDQVPAFVIESGETGFLHSEKENVPPTAICVRYLAPTAGAQSATLVIHSEQGERRVQLRGTSIKVDGATPDAARDGEAVPLPKLQPTEVHDTASARIQLGQAAEAVSRLAQVTDHTVPAADAARVQLLESLISSGAELNKRMVRWLHEEGLEKVRKDNNKPESGAVEFAKFMAQKGIEAVAAHALEIELDPYLGLVMIVIDLGWTAAQLIMTNDESKERINSYTEHMDPIAELAETGADGATRALAKKAAALSGMYHANRSALMGSAATESDEVLRQVHESLQRVDRGDLSTVTSTCAHAVRVVERYTKDRDSWARSFKALAAEGAMAHSAVNRGFKRLLDEYVQFRAGRFEAKNDDSARDAPGARLAEVTGYFDAADGANIQLTGCQFGQMRDMSTTTREYVQSKTLAELAQPEEDIAAWDVRVRLEGIQGGHVDLWQGAGSGARVLLNADGDAGRAAMKIGIDRLWAMLDQAPLGVRVRWANK